MRNRWDLKRLLVAPSAGALEWHILFVETHKGVVMWRSLNRLSTEATWGSLDYFSFTLDSDIQRSGFSWPTPNGTLTCKFQFFPKNYQKRMYPHFNWLWLTKNEGTSRSFPLPLIWFIVNSKSASVADVLRNVKFKFLWWVGKTTYILVLDLSITSQNWSNKNQPILIWSNRSGHFLLDWIIAAWEMLLIWYAGCNCHRFKVFLETCWFPPPPGLCDKLCFSDTFTQLSIDHYRAKNIRAACSYILLFIAVLIKPEWK